MSFGRGGGRGGRGGRGGGSGGAGRGALADLSLGTLSFADLLATSRADIGDVLYPTTGVNLPVTDLPSFQESQTVAPAIDRWLYPAEPSSRQRWVVEGDIKPNVGSKKTKQRSGLAKPFLHQFSQLDLQSERSSEDWLYSDRYKSRDSVNVASVKQSTETSSNASEKSRQILHLLDKSFFPPDLWTSFNEGKKKVATKKSKSKLSAGKIGLAGITDDVDGQEEGDGEKDDKEEEEEAAIIEEDEIDEDDPDYDNNYFDNGDGDEGMDSGGDGGDEGGVF